MQSNGSTPNYGNRPVEEDGLLSRLFKQLAKKRAEAEAAKAAPTKTADVAAAMETQLAGVRKPVNEDTRLRRAGRFALMAIGLMMAVFCAPLMTGHAVLTTLFIAAPVGVLAFSRARGKHWMIVPQIVAIYVVFAVGVFWTANRAMDDTPGEALLLTVSDKYVTQEKRKNEAPHDVYHVSYTLVIPEDTAIHFADTVSGDEETFQVDPDIYTLTYPGRSQVAVTLRQGYFNLPWLARPQLIPLPLEP